MGALATRVTGWMDVVVCHVHGHFRESTQDAEVEAGSLFKMTATEAINALILVASSGS